MDGIIKIFYAGADVSIYSAQLFCHEKTIKIKEKCTAEGTKYYYVYHTCSGISCDLYQSANRYYYYILWRAGSVFYTCHRFVFGVL